MFNIIFLMLLFMFILLIYYYYIHHGRNRRLLNLIPGPPGDPIIGHAFQFHVSAEKQWKLLCSLSDKYYPICKVWMFCTYIVSIRHPDDIKTILSSDSKTSRRYNLLHPWIGTGLFTSTGAKWRERRKILTPAFHFNILNQFADILIKEGNCMTKSLKDVGGVVVKDIVPFISEHTLNAICETAMGISLQKLSKFQQQYRNAAHDIIEMFFYRAFRPWYYNELLFSLSQQGRKQKQILKILHGFTEKVIAERKLYHKSTNYQYLKNLENDNKMEIDDIEVFGIKKKRLAMLDLLIAMSQKNFLSDLDIREEVDTFMFGGHDTTAMAMTFALLLLAEHKDVQECVRLEIDTVMQEDRGKLTMKSLQNLTYLDRCLKETLRLYTVAPFVIRRLEEDIHMLYLLEQTYILISTEFTEIPIFGQIQKCLIRIDSCPKEYVIIILIPIYPSVQDREIA
ncbi:hypothetical protein ACFW04_012015 [Cataglyphis niger]